MKKEEVIINGKPRTISKYIGQNPNDQRMGGRIVPSDGGMWYNDKNIEVPQRGRRKLVKTVKDKKNSEWKSKK